MKLKNRLLASVGALAILAGVAACDNDDVQQGNNVVVVDNGVDNEANPNDCPPASASDATTEPTVECAVKE